MKKVYFKTVEISVICANGESHQYHVNNDYIKYSEKQIADLFNLEPLHFATALDGEIKGEMTSFNTYNWNAPFTFCGVSHPDIYDGIAIVNIHLGGDARGNYSGPYICEEVDALFLQSANLYVELSNGRTFNFDCDNSEAYFNFETFDPYWIDFDKELTKEQIKELEEKQEEY